MLLFGVKYACLVLTSCFSSITFFSAFHSFLTFFSLSMMWNTDCDIATATDIAAVAVMSLEYRFLSLQLKLDLLSRFLKLKNTITNDYARMSFAYSAIRNKTLLSPSSLFLLSSSMLSLLSFHFHSHFPLLFSFSTFHPRSLESFNAQILITIFLLPHLFCPIWRSRKPHHQRPSQLFEREKRTFNRNFRSRLYKPQP